MYCRYVSDNAQNCSEVNRSGNLEKQFEKDSASSSVSFIQTLATDGFGISGALSNFCLAFGLSLKNASIV
jgi:hypothetical protein